MAAPSPTPPSPAARRKTTSVGFRSVLVMMVTVLVAIAAGVPLVLSEDIVSKLRQAQVRETFRLMAAKVGGQFRVQFNSADVVLDTLTTSFPSGVADEKAADRLAHVLADLRETSPAVLALYVAKEDGSFALARAVTDAVRANADRAGVRGAAFELQVGGSDADGRRGGFSYLDADFHPIGRTAPVAVDYDSRQRPWYRLAQGTTKAVLTPPYRFQDYPLSGITISRRGGEDARDVFAVDLTLDDLSTSLKDSVEFKGEQISLIDADGWLLADTEVTTLPTLLGTSGDPLRDRAVRGVDGAAAVFRSYRRSDRPRRLRLAVDGRSVLATFESFRFDNREFLIASTVPVAELERPGRLLAQRSLVLECSLVLLAFVLAVWAAGALTRPLLALASDVGRIVAFRALGAQNGARRPSRLREVRRLGEAVDTLELTLKAFATYTPPRLVRGIVERGALPEIGGSKREVVVLFSDIAGFTSMSEGAAPAVLTMQLSRHLAAIADEVVRTGGTVDKFIGDSVMAFWDGDGDIASAACTAVLAAMAHVERLNADFAAEGLPPLRSRFGLHKGEAMLGSVGTSDRMSYTVLGHTVNVASRIEGLNKEHGTTALVSDAIAMAASGTHGFRHVADATVRGCRASIGLYALVPGGTDGVPSGLA